jgi:hypothetical protein
VLGHGVVYNHSSPRYRQPMSLDIEAPLAYVSADPLVYHAALAPWLNSQESRACDATLAAVRGPS